MAGGLFLLGTNILATGHLSLRGWPAPTCPVLDVRGGADARGPTPLRPMAHQEAAGRVGLSRQGLRPAFSSARRRAIKLCDVAPSIPRLGTTSGNAPTHASHRASSRSPMACPLVDLHVPSGPVMGPLLHRPGVVSFGGLLVRMPQQERCLRQTAAAVQQHGRCEGMQVLDLHRVPARVECR